MKPEEVAEYLRQHPAFFEAQIDLLTEMVLPHPHGGRTISLAERQLLALREKNKSLEMQLSGLLANARENEGLQGKVHEYGVALFAAPDLATLHDMVPHLLQDIFAVPHAVCRIWQVAAPSAEMLGFADTQPHPVCLHQAAHDSGSWFGEAASALHSYAYMPLLAGSESIGLLVLASEDAQRFYPGMGTLFLERIADLTAAALHPLLHAEA